MCLHQYVTNVLPEVVPFCKSCHNCVNIIFSVPGSAVYKSADSTTPTDTNSYSMTLRGGKRTAQDPPAIPTKKTKESTASTPGMSGR